MEREFEHRLTELEGRSRSNQHRIDELEKRQDNLDTLVSTVKVLADREERVECDVREIKGDVKSLKDKPGKRWDAIVDKAVWAILAAVIAFMLGRIGL
jgi:hypothetical protein